MSPSLAKVLWKQSDEKVIFTEELLEKKTKTHENKKPDVTVLYHSENS